MKIKSLIFVSLFVLIIFPAYGQDLRIHKEDSVMTNEEVAIFEKIKKAYPSFNYSKEIVRIFRVDEKSKNKKLILVEINFGEKITQYYDMFYEPDSRIIRFKYGTGSSYRGEGAIIAGEKIIINSSKGCSQSACEVLVTAGKKIIIEQIVE